MAPFEQSNMQHVPYTQFLPKPVWKEIQCTKMKALTKYEWPKMKRDAWQEKKRDARQEKKRLHFLRASLFIFGRLYFVGALIS